MSTSGGGSVAQLSQQATSTVTSYICQFSSSERIEVALFAGDVKSIRRIIMLIEQLSRNVKLRRTLVDVRRRITRRFPILRQTLSPAWMWYGHQLWLLRNWLSGFRPISVGFGNDLIRMVPEGHIAEVLWRVEFEKKERAFVEKQLKPGMCVLNIGANAGLYTLIAAKIVGPQGRVHAFEPATINFRRLERNVAINRLNNVTLNQIAISDVLGTLAVTPDPKYPNLDSHYFVQQVENGRPPESTIELIACDTIDNYWRNVCGETLKQVDMIVIDVEGAELDVFKGAQATFAASPNLVMLVECTRHLEEIDILLRKHGFAFFKWNDSVSALERTNMQRGNIFALRQTEISNM